MSSRTKKSFAWLWIAALLTATVGISVERIYCYCLGETTISFFAGEDPCTEKRNDDSGCCPKQNAPSPKSCCEKDTEACNAIKHDGCTEKSTKVFQMKTEFVVDKPFEKTFDCPLWLREMPTLRRYFAPVVCQYIFSDTPQPPPLSGRDICLRHQLYRC